MPGSPSSLPLAKRGTCSPCLRGHHGHCTTPRTCHHEGPECPEELEIREVEKVDNLEATIVWEEPKQRTRGRWLGECIDQFELIRPALQRNPGRYAVLKEYPPDPKIPAKVHTNTCTQLQKRYKGQGFRFLAREPSKDRRVIYVAFMGDT